MKTFRVKAKEVWKWEFEIEAESKEELEERMYKEFVELCDCEDAIDNQQSWTIKEKRKNEISRRN